MKASCRLKISVVSSKWVFHARICPVDRPQTRSCGLAVEGDILILETRRLQAFELRLSKAIAREMCAWQDIVDLWVLVICWELYTSGRPLRSKVKSKVRGLEREEVVMTAVSGVHHPGVALSSLGTDDLMEID